MNIFGMTVEELRAALAPFGIPRFRAAQIAEGIYRRGAVSFDAITSLPKSLRAQLAENFTIERPTVVNRLHSADGATIKLLYAFADGQTASVRELGLHLHAGGLRDGLRVLRLDTARARAQSDARGDRGAGDRHR